MSAATRRGFLGLIAAAPVAGPQLVASAAALAESVHAPAVGAVALRPSGWVYRRVDRFETITCTVDTRGLSAKLRELDELMAARAGAAGAEGLGRLWLARRHDGGQFGPALACAATAAEMRRPRP